MIVKTKNDIEVIVKDYMTKHFLFEFNETDVTPKTDLFNAGIIDSFGCVELVSFIESKFQVRLSDDELLSGKLKSLESIVKLVKEKIEHAS